MDTSMDLWSFFFTDLYQHLLLSCVMVKTREKLSVGPRKKNLVDACHMQALNKEIKHNGDSDMDVNLACVYWDPNICWSGSNKAKVSEMTMKLHKIYSAHLITMYFRKQQAFGLA